jgi:hypothetical protein
VFKGFLSRLSILIEASISNSHAPARGSPPSSEIIYEGVVERVQDAFICLDGPQKNLYAVWKAPVFLQRPRTRLQGPSAVFSVTAALEPSNAHADGSATRSGYLESKVPSGLNLLQSFAGDSSLGSIEPRLSALRVSRVAPLTQSRPQPRSLKSLHSLAFKVFPIVHTRVRFARPNSVPSGPALVALLEVDFTPFFDCEVRLEEVKLQVEDGVVQDLSSSAGIQLPMVCVAHDHVTFLYRLMPDEVNWESRANATTRDLDIDITITALVDADMCTPKLKMAWSTTVDFTLPLNPGFGTHGLIPPIQRQHRPSQLSISGSNGSSMDAQSLIASPISRPDALPALEAATRNVEATIPDFGITMTLTGPCEPIHLGEEFRWTVFVVNRSPAASATAAAGMPASSAPPAAVASARKLALLAIPRRRRNDVRVLRPPSTSSGPPVGQSQINSKREQLLVADAVLDDSVVHAVQRSSLVDATELVCLSADVRVGPLAPSACAVVDLKFLALQEGVVGLECLRVVDLGSQEHVDVRELPVVIVKRRG